MTTLADIMATWTEQQWEEYIRIGRKALKDYDPRSDLEEMEEAMAYQRHIRDDSQDK